MWCYYAMNDSLSSFLQVKAFSSYGFLDEGNFDKYKEVEVTLLNP